MADFNQAEILKKISFFIDAQFPALYKEFGPDLIQLVKDYYVFLETDTNQSIYNIRRIFEYRDIGQTLASMVIHWQRKFLADLPLKESQVPFVVKNIMDLYRSKGTEQGIKLFFRVFYQEDIEIFYPAQKMFKPSSSFWRTGTFLQMFPNQNRFLSKTGVEYTYLDLLGRNIRGSTSEAKASINKINFIILNGILTPILYIDNLQGNFIKFDDILTQINGEVVSFGKMNGSLVGIDIDTNWALATTGNQIGDVFDVQSKYGVGGRAIVTGVSDEVTGTVSYEVIDGGFGYTVEKTRLLASDQVVILPNANTIFEEGETILDQFLNEGILTGQNEVAFGVKMNVGETFDFDQNPVLRRASFGNTVIQGITDITNKNDSSPGVLFPDADVLDPPADANVHVIADITNEITVSLITDPIQPFLAVTLNASNYNAAPATQPMSGTADPVTIATPLNEAFDLTPFEIGSIRIFKNIDPGENYTNDVFSIAQDSQMKIFERKDQILQVATPAIAGSFNIGEIVTQANSTVSGIVRSSNTQVGSITITPYSYYGFSGANNVVRPNNDEFEVVGISVDYESRNLGDNAEILSEVSFATGKISEVKIFNSGLGYPEGDTAYLANNDVQVAKGTIIANKQGVTEGYWADFESHLNGYERDTGNTYTYFDSSMKIQDSDYYQEYSYEVRSMLAPENYEDFLRSTVHTAGTKLFGKFDYNRKFGSGPEGRGVKQRFIRLFNDDGESGSPLDIGNTQILTSDFLNITSDTQLVTSDNDSSAGGGGGGVSYTYVVTPAATSVDEGSSLAFSVTVTGWPNGTPLYWRVGPGSTRDADFQFQSGNIVMNNGSGSFVLNAVADSSTEGDETFNVTLRTGSGSGTVVYTSPNYTINDTSTGGVSFTPDYIINVTTPIFDYVLNGSHRGGALSNGAQPPLTFFEGDKVEFRIDSSTQSSHPFYLKTAQVAGTGSQISGVTGQGGAVLQWTAAAGSYWYQCAAHSSMNNTITVQSAGP